MKVVHTIIAALAVMLGFTVSQANAALPEAVDGKALPTLAPMLQRTTPGVVNIATRAHVRTRTNPFFDDPFFRHFFELPQQPRERITRSLGSGVIVDADNGYILTNNHVIDGADEITVTLLDGRELDANLIGTDPDSDVAVIQIQANNLNALPWGNSEKLRVGDFVVAIGNPFGLGQTVTSGIVSALQRSGLGIEAYEDFIQTDASINPGNSGGALVDLNGRLIGINTAIMGPSGGSIGIGFAIPSAMAQQIMQQLIEHGEVRRGRLGIRMQDIDAELARAFDLARKNGVIISDVESQSPAEKAGLQVGDIVIEVDGRKVRSSDDMNNVIGLQRIGQVVKMKVLRGAAESEIKAIIEENPVRVTDGAEVHPKLEGARLAPVSAILNRSDYEGLMVAEVEPRSAASIAGLREGDIITSINRQAVNTIEEAQSLIERSHRGIIINIRRGDRAMFMVLR